MRLVIEKELGVIRIEATTDTSKKPLVLCLSPHEAETLIGLLSTANKADKMKFVLEL